MDVGLALDHWCVRSVCCVDRGLARLAAGSAAPPPSDIPTGPLDLLRRNAMKKVTAPIPVAGSQLDQTRRHLLGKQIVCRRRHGNDVRNAR
jgi:hypothetical protein